ncbi:MBL fold metallo-hydrolase [Thermosyntropha sp.]|uniref:MBL fold metallo-hydrolase n=1 Tax=Thermosyntropha sp. TaxID=2740820 RepID=UPI0025FB6994|nr:MBL fold metallo-hydrolase [Thermosyntropha sp.]MBO8158333.1 MBL fold metallo-hydrolase [Thermosyntropha sp.]
MNTKITILVENTTPVPGLTGEYGFAALIERNEKKYLFDTGSKDALFNNARFLGIDLNEVSELIISHGHFDHTGAVLPLVRDYQIKKIYAHSGIFVSRPVFLGDGNFREIGCAFKKEEVLNLGVELIWTDEFTEISPGIFVTGEIPRNNRFEDVGGPFKVKIENNIANDVLPDDMALVIDDKDGLVIISGCAHAGMINTIDYVVQKTGRSIIKAYIGGTHLITASKERIDRTIESLNNYHIEKIIVCHCTGFYAASLLYNALGDRIIKGETGMSFTF